MVSRGVFSLLLAVGLLSVLVFGDDELYLQEVSHKSVFSGYEAPVDAPVSKVWEQLPFSSDGMQKNAFVSLFPGRSCVLALAQGSLYGISTKTNSPPLQTLESPFTKWQLLDSSLKGASPTHITKSYDGRLFAATASNLLEITLEGEGCGTVTSAVKILKEDIPQPGWGTITAMQAAPEVNSVFVGTLGAPVRRISLRSGTTVEMNVNAVGSYSNTMLWVKKHRKLYTANDVALHWMSFGADGRLLADTANREFVGGVLGSEPTDLAYDALNDWVWLAEMEAVHKVTPEGSIHRFGYAQMAPMYNISSVAVAGSVVWVGSSVSGMSRLWSDTSSAQVWSKGPNYSREAHTTRTRALYEDQASGPVDPEGDPWTWQYYMGPRWLPANEVFGLLADEHSPKTDSGVFALTTAGLGYLHVSQWTLEQKAEAWLQFQYPQHERNGFMCSVGLKSFGDRSDFVKGVTDNDGLWTSSSLLAQGYRRLIALEKGDKEDAEDARKTGWGGFEALEYASKVTPAYPKYVARSFCKISDGDSGCPSSPVDPPAGWYNGTEEGWMYKGDTSSDTLAGHVVSYPIAYDLLASTAEERERVLTMINGITTGIIENDYFLIDPETGKPTKWGYWNPEWLNNDPQYYSERGENSLGMLGMLASAYSITGKKLYKDSFWNLVNVHRYDYNIMNVKIDSCVDENHSDTNLMMLAYHTYFYALWRLPKDHERYEEVKAMTDLAVPGLRRSWELIQDEMNPVWLGMIGGTANLRDEITKEHLDAAVWSLRHWAIDGIDWKISGSQRTDLDVSTHQQWFHVRNSNPPVPYMRFIRPPSEQFASERNLDPFTIDTDTNGNVEMEPGLWQLPYYLMKANNFI